MKVRPGKYYRHFKGNRYVVIAIATHTETGESMVVYASVSDPEKIWCRPLSMFTEKVIRDGKEFQRFTEEVL